MAEGKDEKQLEELDIALGMTGDPAADALAALREHQEVTGLRFDNPDAPVAAPRGDEVF